MADVKVLTIFENNCERTGVWAAFCERSYGGIGASQGRCPKVQHAAKSHSQVGVLEGTTRSQVTQPGGVRRYNTQPSYTAQAASEGTTRSQVAPPRRRPKVQHAAKSHSAGRCPKVQTHTLASNKRKNIFLSCLFV